MQINISSQQAINKKNKVTFGVNIKNLALAHQAPTLRYGVSAQRGQLVDRSLGRPDCRGTRNRIRAALHVAYKVWQEGLYPKDKPLPLSPKEIGTDIPAVWRKFISSIPKTDPNGPHKIGELLIADLQQWKKNWEALSRAAKIDSNNAILDSLELKANTIPSEQLPSLARHHNIPTKDLTPELLEKISAKNTVKENEFKDKASLLTEPDVLTFGDLPKALDELQISQGNTKNRIEQIPFSPWNPKWYSDASLNAGGPLRDC